MWFFFFSENSPNCLTKYFDVGVMETIVEPWPWINFFAFGAPLILVRLNLSHPIASFLITAHVLTSRLSRRGVNRVFFC